MFNKFNANTFHRTIHGLKRGILHGYNQVKNISNHIHDGVTTAAHVYKAVAPIINHYAPQHGKSIHHTVNHLASGYSSLRNKVLEADGHVNSVGGKLGGLV
jgi:hypothetical protein